MREYELINENLRCALASFSHVTNAGEIIEDGGLSLAYAGVPFGLFNTALLTSRLADGEFSTRLRNASDHFQRRRTPWSVWYCEDLLSLAERRRARQALDAMNLKPVMEAPGMIANHLSRPAKMLPPLACKRVCDSETMGDFSRIMASAFEVPIDMANRVYASDLLWLGPMSGWIGYVNRVPVATAAVVAGGGCIGLYAVATHPQYQRRGYGESLMRTVLDFVKAESGIETVVLQSSPAGFRLYQRMGFRPVTRFSVFLSG